MSLSSHTVTEPRPLRADARRNRDRLLACAAEAFDERGTEASLEDIARRAGVGIGTLYRHFPTRDALVEAVYRREVDAVVSTAAQLLAEHDPATALSTWMRAFARYVARKKGMAAALRAMIEADNTRFDDTRRQIREAVDSLVSAAARSGAIRSDVDPQDLLRAVGGICMATDSGATPHDVDATARLCDLLMDGLRYGAPGPA